jgi:hypothetical protein
MSNVCHSTLKVYGPANLGERACSVILPVFGPCLQESSNPFLETEASNPPLAVVRIETEDVPPVRAVADISLLEPELRFELLFSNWASGFQGGRIYQRGIVTSGEDSPFCIEEELAESAGASSIVDAGDAQPANDQPGGTAPDRLYDSAESILQRARQRANGGRSTRVPSDETLPWVHDSWVGECEAAGVYSRKAPVFNYEDKPAITVTLSATEVRLVAQRHLNTFMGWNEFYAWNGLGEGAFAERATIHEVRFRGLYESLPHEDQERLQRQLEIRQRYIESVAAEVARCEKVESEFWKQADAGLVSEAEIASHRTPSFIAGLPVMPPSADGGPGPEEWDMF